MKLKIIKYDGTKIFLDALSFEFRTNQVANWIKAKVVDDQKTIMSDVTIHDVCVVKTVE